MWCGEGFVGSYYFYLPSLYCLSFEVVCCACSTPPPFVIHMRIWIRALLVLVSVPGTVNIGGLNLEA